MLFNNCAIWRWKQQGLLRTCLHWKWGAKLLMCLQGLLPLSGRSKERKNGYVAVFCFGRTKAEHWGFLMAATLLIFTCMWHHACKWQMKIYLCTEIACIPWIQVFGGKQYLWPDCCLLESFSGWNMSRWCDAMIRCLFVCFCVCCVKSLGMRTGFLMGLQPWHGSTAPLMCVWWMSTEWGTEWATG